MIKHLVLNLPARIYIQDFRFPSFPRKRESSKPLKKLDTCFHGYDESKFPAKVLI